MPFLAPAQGAQPAQTSPASRPLYLLPALPRAGTAMLVPVLPIVPAAVAWPFALKACVCVLAGLFRERLLLKDLQQYCNYCCCSLTFGDVLDYSSTYYS